MKNSFDILTNHVVRIQTLLVELAETNNLLMKDILSLKKEVKKLKDERKK